MAGLEPAPALTGEALYLSGRTKGSDDGVEDDLPQAIPEPGDNDHAVVSGAASAGYRQGTPTAGGAAVKEPLMAVLSASVQVASSWDSSPERGVHSPVHWTTTLMDINEERTVSRGYISMDEECPEQETGLRKCAIRLGRYLNSLGTAEANRDQARVDEEIA